MNSTTITRKEPEEIVGDPAWLPDRLDLPQGHIHFARLDRQRLEREAFLDERKTATAAAAVSIAALAQHLAASAQTQAETSAQPPVLIFHSAFCCSTLMARALDAPGVALSLKEPSIMMDLANAYRMAKPGADLKAVDQTRDIIFKLLARPHQHNERAVIKPTNTANNIAPVAAQAGMRMILLYGDLKGFLISVLKKGEPCKAFVRKQYNIFALDKEGVAAIPPRQAMGFTDLQVAALVWRHQAEMFTRLLANSSDDTIKSLDFRTLLDKPAETLMAASQHFALGLSEETIAATVAGPIFATNAKFGDVSYDAAARARDESDLVERHGEELAMIEHWASNVKLSVDIALPLAKPLL